MNNNHNWSKCEECLPPYEEGLRVLIYTAGHDFGGEQFFDVFAIDLYPSMNPDNDRCDKEVCNYATHWAYHPILY